MLVKFHLCRCSMFWMIFSMIVHGLFHLRRSYFICHSWRRQKKKMKLNCVRSFQLTRVNCIALTGSLPTYALHTIHRECITVPVLVSHGSKKLIGRSFYWTHEMLDVASTTAAIVPKRFRDRYSKSVGIPT